VFTLQLYVTLQTRVSPTIAFRVLELLPIVSPMEQSHVTTDLFVRQSNAFKALVVSTRTFRARPPLLATTRLVATAPVGLAF